MATLSETDQKSVIALRRFNVLTDVNAHRLIQEDGIISIPCADGDQMLDVFQHQVKLAVEGGVQPRLHQLSLNGGALLIPENSPLNNVLREDRVLLAHIRGGIKLKGIHTIVLYTHAPCGAAGLAGLSFEQCVDLLLCAKERIKREIPEVRVACFCHIDRVQDGQHKKRTYFVDEERWKVWQIQERRGQK